MSREQMSLANIETLSDGWRGLFKDTLKFLATGEIEMPNDFNYPLPEVKDPFILTIENLRIALATCELNSNDRIPELSQLCLSFCGLDDETPPSPPIFVTGQNRTRVSPGGLGYPVNATEPSVAHAMAGLYVFTQTVNRLNGKLNAIDGDFYIIPANQKNLS